MSRTITIDSGPVFVDTESLRGTGAILEFARWALERAVAELNRAQVILAGAVSAEALYASSALSQILWQIGAAHLIEEAKECAEGLRVAANIYDYSDHNAANTVLSAHVDHMNGLYFQHRLNSVAQALYPQIRGADILYRLSEHREQILSGCIDENTVNVPKIMRNLGIWAAVAGVTQAQLMRRADTPLERSAALLSRHYPRIEKWEGRYLPMLAVRGSNPRGTHIHTRVERDSYLFGLEHYATEILAVPAVHRLVAPRDATSTPHTPSALITKVQRLRDEPSAPSARTTANSAPASGEFEIERHETPGAQRPTWSVVVKGTQEWFPGTSNPKDMQSNLALVGRVPADEEAAVVWALSQSGVQPGDTIEFVGHSQGGIVAASLAASSAITDHYTVAGVVTAGSPISGIELPETTPVLAFENTNDIVPALDGQTTSTSATRITVYSTGEGSPHDLGGYIADAKDAEKTGHSEFDRWVRKRQIALGLTDDTVTTSQRYAITRVMRQ
ncbi:MAG: hypothetical protein Q4P71_03255 [Actinomycetaceae bacterium]|nr:hypothetical protein [Actinomycetaceae bacterium]